MKLRIYLAHAEKGVHAHMLDLPGCFARGADQAEAVRRATRAAETYLQDLLRHGKAVGIPEVFYPEIVEINQNASGPIDPGDSAALFTAEMQPIPAEAVEPFLQLAGYNRADLLALVRDLPDEILDWQAPGQDAWTIRRILRHIGSADQWYVSRLLPPDRLPLEWANDEDLPIHEFLEMSRRTTLQALRELTDADRGGQAVFPTHHTTDPSEPWTARKALRRMLEHEREHTGHIREILVAWRLAWKARAAVERSRLFQAAAKFDEATFCSAPIFEDWTGKDLLYHLAAWDRLHLARLRAARDGRTEDIVEISGADFYAAENERLHAEGSEVPLPAVLEEMDSARRDLLAVVDGLSDEALHRAYPMPNGETLLLGPYLENRFRHDAAHRGDLSGWLKRQEYKTLDYSRDLVLAAMRSARDEIAALAACVPAEELETRPVTGKWSMRDVVIHLLAWEQITCSQLESALAGETTEKIAAYADPPVDDINEKLQADHDGRSWTEVWADYWSLRGKMIDLLEDAPESALAGKMTPPWGGEQMVFDLFALWPSHDREHAEVILVELGM